MTVSSPAAPVPSTSASVAERLAAARAAIVRACEAAGRAPGTVTLTAVVKTQPPQAVDAALAAGQRVFGENRVQEAQGRWSGRDRTGLELRLIGPLQTNKALDAVRLFDVIETLDRPRLVQALARAADQAGRRPRCLIQVNTGLEPQKAGAAPDAVPALLDLARAHGLAVEGLMCIPPADEDPVPHFARLRDLAARLGLDVLSMGMSGDYPAAVAQGATHVRLGSALFGARNPPPETA
jgi:pyridoxal phosphate enzyme (YggS family)